MLIAIIVMSVMLFFLCVLCAYLLTERNGIINTLKYHESRISLSEKYTERLERSIADLKQKKSDEDKLTEEQQKQLKKRNEGFQNIMDYDINVALNAKKVSN
jgi:cysteinyl-tRNA synthetase